MILGIGSSIIKFIIIFIKIKIIQSIENYSLWEHNINLEIAVSSLKHYLVQIIKALLSV